jgi:glyoxylase-like metal-dependent hydrolase (beta-lactamase superfamily II)
MPAKPLTTALFSGLLFVACSTAQKEPPPPPTIIAGSYTADRQPDGNTIIFEEPDGLVVVDTGRHLDHQQKILDFARARGKPITAIVNTHWHLDHSGGNAEIRAVYPAAPLYTSNAVAGALEGFLARSLERGRARLADPRLSEAEKAETRLGVDAIADRRNLLPDVPVTGTTRMPADHRGLVLHLARNAATEGDVWIYDPASRTVVAGDLVVVPAPFFDTGCPEGWQQALAELSATPFETLVPGHGERMTRAEFSLYRSAFDALVACARSAAAKENCIDGWQHDAAYFLPREDDRKNARELLNYYIDDILRNQEKLQEFCAS